VSDDIQWAFEQADAGNHAGAIQALCNQIRAIKRRLSALESRAGGEAGKDGELLPCPFCGSDARVRTMAESLAFANPDLPRDDGTWHAVQCNNRTGYCRVSGPVLKTREEARTAWNRRSGGANAQPLFPPPSDAEREAGYLYSKRFLQAILLSQEITAGSIESVQRILNVAERVAHADRSPPADAAQGAGDE
jgi:hypothetical protein